MASGSNDAPSSSPALAPSPNEYTNVEGGSEDSDEEPLPPLFLKDDIRGRRFQGPCTRLMNDIEWAWRDQDYDGGALGGCYHRVAYRFLSGEVPALVPEKNRGDSKNAVARRNQSIAVAKGAFFTPKPVTRAWNSAPLKAPFKPPHNIFRWHLGVTTNLQK